MAFNNFFFVAFIPMILSQIIARLYIIKNLEKPANFTAAPWYVRWSLNSGVAQLFHLKESVLFYLIGFIGFSVCLIASISQLLGWLMVFMLLSVIGILQFWMAVSWMDKNQRWGSRKQTADMDKTSVFGHIVKDRFLLFQAIVVAFMVLLLGYTQLREIVRAKGYEAGAKEAKEQMREDSLRSLENK